MGGGRNLHTRMSGTESFAVPSAGPAILPGPVGCAGPAHAPTAVQDPGCTAHRLFELLLRRTSGGSDGSGMETVLDAHEARVGAELAASALWFPWGSRRHVPAGRGFPAEAALGAAPPSPRRPRGHPAGDKPNTHRLHPRLPRLGPRGARAARSPPLCLPPHRENWRRKGLESKRNKK